MTFLPYTVLQMLVLVALTLSTLYLFIYAVAGLFYHQPSYTLNPLMRRIAVLIPGYQEDKVIISTVQNAMLQDYPRDLFEVVVIADSFNSITLDALRALPVKTIEVSFECRTKAKALNQALQQLSGQYDIALVLDADNIMAPGFLNKINAAFESGVLVVQGRRKAKNMDTSLAVLDAISEEINNHIFRRGHRVVGLSAALTGSAMAFRYGFFKQLMPAITAVGGFDKEIELTLLRDNIEIEYLDDAVVYDEKTGNADAFSNQRRRWLAAQYHYFHKDFSASFIAMITRGNIGYFQKTIQFIQPPRVLLLGAVLMFGTAAIVINLLLGGYPVLSYLWAGVILLVLLTFLFSIPRRFYNFSTLKAMTCLPLGMMLMLGSLLHIKGANKQFLHTTHTSVTTP